MLYYVLHATNSVAMVNHIYLNFVKPIAKKNEEKGHPLSQFYNIDHRKRNLVCMCRSTTPLFKSVILHNIRLIRCHGYHIDG